MSCPASAGHRVRRSQRKSIAKPILHLAEDGAIATEHPEPRTYRLFTEGNPALLFCDNETNVRRLYDQQGVQGHFKDAFSEYVVNGNHDAVNPNRTGTKAAAHYVLDVPAQDSRTVRLRFARSLSPHPDPLPKEREQQAPASGDPKRIDGSQPGGTILPLPEGECREGEAFRAFADFDSIFAQRRREADEFYAELQKDIADFGVRATSRTHRGNPYQFHVNGGTMSVEYQPAESNSGLFGGNSNWRGPIWMPLNYLLIESLQKFHHYYGDDFKVECPTGSGQFKTINEVADELSRRLTKLFLKGEDGQRPVLKYHPKLATDPHFKDYVLFHEYFHGDTGRGVGASHQTGWTGLVARLLQPRAPARYSKLRVHAAANSKQNSRPRKSRKSALAMA